MPLLRLIRVSLLGLAVWGCATVLSGTSQTLTVNANVDAAQVYFNDSLLGTTPLTAKVQRGKVGVLKISKTGYRPYQAALNKKVTSTFWVNIFSGTLGSTTDYATGAMYEYEPSTFMISLQPSEQSTEAVKEWERKEKFRAFILNNSAAIVADLAAGRGEYVDVLIDFFGVEPGARTEAIHRWRAAYDTSKTSAAFAAAIVAGGDR